MDHFEWDEFFPALSIIVFIIAASVFLTQIVSCTVEYERLNKTEKCIGNFSGKPVEEVQAIVSSCQEAFSEKSVDK